MFVYELRSTICKGNIKIGSQHSIYDAGCNRMSAIESDEAINKLPYPPEMLTMMDMDS